MSLGLVGRKVGMTRIFTDDGASVPVTVLDVSNNRVAQIKTPENDGYAAIQVAFGKRRPSRVTKSLAGHLAKAGVEAGEIIREFPVTAEVAGKYVAGAAVPVAQRLLGCHRRQRAAGRACAADQSGRPARAAAGENRGVGQWHHQDRTSRMICEAQTRVS